mmetsp:Transcript_29195/g.44574  ORF Transcript_29195/g.44574 Transcript_29195/m.44574 type:complete len:96 (+) Transcript_29195:736-1023(+)
MVKQFEIRVEIRPPYTIIPLLIPQSTADFSRFIKPSQTSRCEEKGRDVCRREEIEMMQSMKRAPSKMVQKTSTSNESSPSQSFSPKEHEHPAWTK